MVVSGDEVEGCWRWGREGILKVHVRLIDFEKLCQLASVIVHVSDIETKTELKFKVGAVVINF